MDSDLSLVTGLLMAFVMSQSVRRKAVKRIEIVLRQTEQDTVSETVLASFENTATLFTEHSASNMIFPGLTISLYERIVYRNGEPLLLTSKEFSTLVFLAQHPKWVHTATEIYEAVWCNNGSQCGNAVSKIIGRLRRKLTPGSPHGGYIHTISGQGYRFEVPKDL